MNALELKYREVRCRLYNPVPRTPPKPKPGLVPVWEPPPPPPTRKQYAQQFNDWLAAVRASMGDGVAQNIVLGHNFFVSPHTPSGLIQFPLTVGGIQRATALHFNIPMESYLSARRSAAIVYPRHVGMYLCREILKLSYPRISRRFGKKDHTTCMHGVQVIEARLGADEELQTDITAIKQKLGAA